eukprot:363264-Chlamydomonas_euryale.AAC.6
MRVAATAISRQSAAVASAAAGERSPRGVAAASVARSRAQAATWPSHHHRGPTQAFQQPRPQPPPRHALHARPCAPPATRLRRSAAAAERRDVSVRPAAASWPAVRPPEPSGAMPIFRTEPSGPLHVGVADLSLYDGPGMLDPSRVGCAHNAIPVWMGEGRGSVDE